MENINWDGNGNPQLGLDKLGCVAELPMLCGAGVSEGMGEGCLRACGKSGRTITLSARRLLGLSATHHPPPVLQLVPLVNSAVTRLQPGPYYCAPDQPFGVPAIRKDDCASLGWSSRDTS